MNREECLDWLCRLRSEIYVYMPKEWIIPMNNALDMVIKALEQEPKMEQFVRWVATEIFDDYWEYNKDAFAEIACRKLAKLGIVKANGGIWELIEPQESEVSDADSD